MIQGKIKWPILGLFLVLLIFTFQNCGPGFEAQDFDGSQFNLSRIDQDHAKVPDTIIDPPGQNPLPDPMEEPLPEPMPDPTPEEPMPPKQEPQHKVRVTDTQYMAGANIQIDIETTGASNSAWVGVFAINATNREGLSWVYLNGTQDLPAAPIQSATVMLPAPEVAGDYHIRLLSEDSPNAAILSQSSNFKVVAKPAEPMPQPMPEPTPEPTPDPVIPPVPEPQSNTTAADYKKFLDTFYPKRPYSLTDVSILKKTVGQGQNPWDVMSNDVIGVSGGVERKTSTRFRARYSEYLTSIRVYWIASTTPGYSSGNGGRIRMRIFDDQNGIPNESGKLYGESLFVPALNSQQQITANGGGYFQNHTFSQLAPLVAGKRYHIVFDNVDPNPSVNWISRESANTRGDNVPKDAIFDRSDWVTLRKDGNKAWWAVDDSYAFLQPMMQVNQKSGSYGFGMYSPGNFTDRTFVFKNANPIRTRIRPSTTRKWYGGSIAMNTSTGGYIDWKLTTEEGTVLASGSFHQPSANDSFTAQENTSYKFTSWFPFYFGSGITLTANKNYYMTYTPRGSSTWRSTTNGDGRPSDRFPLLAWPELSAQHYYNGKFIFSEQYSQTSGSDSGNWREYFITD